MLGNRTNSVLLPFLDSITKLKLIRDHSNMALRCKSGRNKLYKVKVCQNIMFQYGSLHHMC